MKTILLTGGSGFIGRNVQESFLAQKYRVLAPGHQELDLCDENALDAYLSAHKPDFVIHAACKPAHRNAKDPRDIFYANSRMFFNLRRQADSFEKFLFLGSGSVYDMRRYRPKMKEERAWEVLPADELGLYKHAVSRVIENTAHMTDLRVFGIFGPHEDYAIRFISNAICKTLFDLPITLKQNRKFDYIWVSDFLRILDLFLERDAPQRAYNITPDTSVELLELAKLVNKISGKNLPIVVKEPGLGPEYSGNNARFKQTFPDFRFTPLDEAVRTLYAWYAARKENLNKALLLTDK